MLSQRQRTLRFLLDDAPQAVALASAALVGVALFLRIFGWKYALGASAYWSWPHGDAGMTLTGWNYFIHDRWHWPLGKTTLANSPAGVDILFFDAIPLVAIAGKLLVPVLGTHWHPYGLWHCAVYGLQGLFAALLVRRLGVRGLVGALAAAALCVSSTAFLLRFYHEDLDGQFVLLWALFAYACSVPSASPRWLIANWVACACVSLLVQPYLTAMVVLVAIAAHARLASSRPALALRSASIVGVALAATWFVAGYCAPVPTDAEASAFGVASMNLLSPLVPMHSALLPRAAAVAQDGTGMQWDGQNFLGVGVLGLALLAAFGGARAVGRALRSHVALASMLGVLAVYSLGHRWYLGKHGIVHFAFVESLPSSLRTFRATGRFFWTVGYAVAIASMVLVIRRYGRRGVVAAAMLASLQLVDSTPWWTLIATETAEPWTRHADWEAWRSVLPHYQKLALYPSWYCWGADDPGDPMLGAEREIELMAAESGVAVDHSRTGRVLVDCSKGRIDTASLARSGLAEGKLYAFFRPVYGRADIERLGRAHCTDFRHGWLCARDAPAPRMPRLVADR